MAERPKSTGHQKPERPEKTVAQNRKARHEYFIEETFEAGVVLTGTEVKSIRMGRASMSDAYAEVKNGEVFVNNLHISPYEMGNVFNVDPLRSRKLLLNKKEIARLTGYIQQKGFTLIPLRLYLSSKNLVKLELAIARGKKLYDKRDSIAKRDSERNIQKELRERQKY
ncbi:MAG: SsrA-binding protein SmpB [Acidaminobacter sp.]|uniref:SsrA-binding protein SmpB n=1 Tax=Acidaminobacter sp. TaxID=1872102 RepID=UPI001385772A|nr:SsrA-binding protein SmpB [Acidaminobacter sp.]MZQ99068.1 SsrA-binding protein SmpB [Acidaminobacter sp.]